MIGFTPKLVDDLPIAIYTCDEKGYITAYNKAAADLWGREPELGKELWCGSLKIYNPDGTDLAADRCPMARILKEGISVEGQEIIIERPDGERRNLRPCPVLTFDSEGNISGAINTLIDITDQRQNEQKQSTLAAIIESSDDAIISKTLAGIITSWNKGAERIFGYTENEVIGKHISLLIPEERIDEENVIIGKVRAGDKVDHFETIRKTKSGALIPISLTVSAVRDANGVIVGASKIARDISIQHQAAETIRKHAANLEILNSFGRSVSGALDTQDILQTVTDVTTRLTGAAFGAFFYNVTDEQGGSYMLYTLSGASRDDFDKFGMPRNTAVFHPTFSGQGNIRVDDITKDPRYGKNDPHFGMPKGHLPVVSYLAVPVISKSGEVIGGLFYGHPRPGMFTEDHEMQVAGVASHAAVVLDNAKLFNEVQALNSKKDEFIGVASHELKTPVTSISAYLQILQRNLSEDEKNYGLTVKALQQVRKLSSLISDLLDISKIESGKLPLTFSTFDILELIREVVEMMQYASSNHVIQFNHNIAELLIHADRQRIEQVMINLISNAIKYSPNGDRVIIAAKQVGDDILVSVQDFGIGIKKDQQPRIFSRFYRVEDLAPHLSGLGIGLYLCHEIITRHQGILNVHSEPEKGSTFSFIIPKGI